MLKQYINYSNFSDSCHATCFYETALGPNASTTGDVRPDSGVPTNELVKVWDVYCFVSRPAEFNMHVCMFDV